MCTFVQNRCCSSIKLAMHAACPPQSLAGREAAALRDLPVSRRGGCSPCITRAAPASLQTRVFPHLAAAGRDPVYLPSAHCLLLFCTGPFLLGFWKRSFDLQMRKEEGSRSEAEWTGRETACWIMLIRLHSAMENPFSFFGPKYERTESFSLKPRR